MIFLLTFQFLSFLFLFGNNAMSSASQLTKEVPEIEYLHIKSEVRMRFATTQVVSKMVNHKNYSTEAIFNVILPNKAFISNFSLEMDGVVYPGQVQEKEKSQKDLEKAKRKGLSTGHVSQKPRETNRFLVTINVAANHEVKFDLRYQELLQRRLGYYEHPIYVDPGQPVQQVSIEIFIEETKKISFVRVPPLRPNDPSLPPIETSDDVRIVRPSPLTAYVFYAPSKKEVSLSGAFIVEYEVDRKFDSGEILAVNGYFVHFFAPEGLKPLPKDILFILDTSNSMEGKKIDQLREAMLEILTDLNEGDRFNLLRFAQNLEFWRPAMQKWNPANRQEALNWISHLQSGSITNVNGALVEGLKMMSEVREETNDTRSTIVVFLTDGEATEGETNKGRILSNVDQINKYGIPVFGLSFGADADFDLMRKLSLRNNAVARRIYEASDTSLQLKHFYDEISAALIADLKFTYLGDNVDNSTITSRRFQNYYNGTEEVVAGRLSDNSSSVTLKIDGSVEKGSIEDIEPVRSIELRNSSQGIGLLTDADIRALPEKLWAYLTIKQLEDKRIASNDVEEKEKLAKDMLDLSLKYKFVTPVTSMLIVKPKDEVLPTKPPVKKDEKSEKEVQNKEEVESQTGSPIKKEVESETGSSSKKDAESETGSSSKKDAESETGSSSKKDAESETGSSSKKDAESETGSRSEEEVETDTGSPSKEDVAIEETDPPTSREEYNVESETNDPIPETEIVSGGVYGDPHFLMSIPGISLPICFHILGKKGDILNLLSDPKNGVSIRAEIMEGDNHFQNNDWFKTYMRRIVIQSRWVSLDINPERIVYNGRVYFWKKESAVTNRKINLVINGRGHDLLINLGKGQQVHVKRSFAGKKEKRFKYLDFYLIDGSGVSNESTGVLGQLIHVKGQLKHIEHNRKGQTVGKLVVTGGIHDRAKPRIVHAVLNLQQFSLSHEPVSCWIIRHGLRNLIKGNYFAKTISPTLTGKESSSGQ